VFPLAGTYLHRAGCLMAARYLFRADMGRSSDWRSFRPSATLHRGLRYLHASGNSGNYSGRFGSDASGRLRIGRDSVSRDAESSERSAWMSDALRSEDSASRLTVGCHGKSIQEFSSSRESASPHSMKRTTGSMIAPPHSITSSIFRLGLWAISRLRFAGFPIHAKRKREIAHPNHSTTA